MANEKHRRAFISYSRINKEFATKLVKGLRSEGYPVWFDLLDIPTGARWDDEVEKALRECSIFVIILTPASIASENVKDEIGYAIDHGKRILPLLLEECDVPLRLRRFQYVDFTTKSFEEGFQSAKDLLGDLIDEASTPLAPKAPVVEAQIDQKTEAERLAKQKAEAEQLAQAKAETERKAKEEADRLAAEKAAAVLLAKQNADDELATNAKAESERKAKEEADRLAAQKAEAEYEAKERAKSADEKAKPIPVPASTQKKSISKGLVIGIVAVVLLCIAGIGIGIGALSNRGTPATEAPYVGEPATEAPAADAPACPSESNESVQVLLENQSSLVIDYYWLDFDCTQQYYGTLAPGETATLDTYVSHIWQFVDQQTGSVYAEYQADTNGYFAIPATEAPAATEPANPQLELIANYSLDGTTTDGLNSYPDINVVNAPFSDGGVYCNGIYIYSGDNVTDYCLIETPPIYGLNYQNYVIAVDFYVSEYPSDSEYPSGMVVIMGGTSYRWNGFYLLSNGNIGYWYGNQDTIDCQYPYQLNTWQNAQLYYDGTVGQLYLDGNLACNVEFSVNTGGGDDDKIISTTNYSNGTTFRGLIRNLQIMSSR